jgi:hypothetical protein
MCCQPTSQAGHEGHEAAAQRTSDSALDRRQGKQVQGHTTAQDPAGPRRETRLAAFQDAVFDTDPAAASPRAIGQCP